MSVIGEYTADNLFNSCDDGRMSCCSYMINLNKLCGLYKHVQVLEMIENGELIFLKRGNV